MVFPKLNFGKKDKKNSVEEKKDNFVNKESLKGKKEEKRPLKTQKTSKSTKSKKAPMSKSLESLFTPTPLPKHSIVRFELKNLEVPDISEYDIKRQYFVGPCKVYIATDPTGKLAYLISEPPVGKAAKLLYPKIMNYLFVSLSYDVTEQDKEDKNSFARRKILEISKELDFSQHIVNYIDSLEYYVVRDSFGYGIIDVLMNDPEIEDIVEESYERPVGVAHRQYGEYGILDTNIYFNTLDAASSFVQKLVQKTGKSMTAAVPYIDSMTKEGHRIAATFGKEVSLPGPNFTIRKFSEEPYTITRLLEFGTMNAMMAAYVWLLLESKAFVLVIGSTSAGKTTTIGALSSLINPQMKITTIEDTAELKMGHTHWQRLLTRKSSSLFEDKYEVTMDDLVKLSLRSRPDYIVVGEVRGKEISSLVQAVSTGHGGLTSFHASDAKSAFVRMESPPMNVHVGGQMLISAIIQQNRMVDPDGRVTRRVAAITEIIPKEGVTLNKLFEWNASRAKFLPTEVSDVVSKSYRLSEIAQINGWSRDELTNQLVTRMCFLSRLRHEGKTKFSEVKKELESFYYDPMKRYTDLLDAEGLDDSGNAVY